MRMAVWLRSNTVAVKVRWHVIHAVALNSSPGGVDALSRRWLFSMEAISPHQAGCCYSKGSEDPAMVSRIIRSRYERAPLFTLRWLTSSYCSTMEAYIVIAAWKHRGSVPRYVLTVSSRWRGKHISHMLASPIPRSNALFSDYVVVSAFHSHF